MFFMNIFYFPFCAVLCIIFNGFTSVVLSYSFNLKDVVVLNSDANEESYFGYSLLLQKGDPSVVIVGAPKQTTEERGGSAFKCTLNGQNSCEDIPYDSGPSLSPNGIFFGGTVDGENYSGGNFSICAHLWAKDTTFERRKNGFYYPKGRCFYSTSGNTHLKVLSPFENRQDQSNSRSPYHDFGLALTGLDHTYIQDDHNIFLGVPGAKQFDGITASCSVEKESTCIEIPNKEGERPNDDTAYLGYKVATVKFDQTRQQKRKYIAGAPRANFLKGKVTVFKHHSTSPHQIKTIMNFWGDEVGSYFGSTVLAVDVNNDDIDDILIGAPMSAGATYDEGYVNLYLIERNILNPDAVKLTGSKQTGSRFGSSIATLGDFDLDSFNDVAISAPYENDGVGAVYIYRGSKNGLEFSQIISPSDFSVTAGSNVAGFGLGMSRGVDTDGNGHNDLAVGAYKSNKVFLITTYPIIDYVLSIQPNVSSIGTDTSSFDIEFCFVYTQRSTVHDVKTIEVGLTLDLDYRTNENGLKVFNKTVKLNKKFCDNYIVKIRDTSGDISNFEIALLAEVKTNKIVANGKNLVESLIPFAHGCGNDNICNTKLSVALNSNSSEIIPGLDKEFQLEVEVTNEGEPAYQCRLKIEVPENVDLHNTEDCERDDDSVLICFVDKRLLGTKKKLYHFDVSALDPSTTEVEIRVDVISLGHNDLNFTDLGFISVPVSLRNSPYIVGKSDPDTIDLEINKDKKIEIVHRFTVGNLGPSPVKLDVTILLPILGNEDNFHVPVRGVLRGEEILCTPHNSSLLDIPQVQNLEDSFNVPINKSIQVTCFNEKCVKYSCHGGYLVTSNEVAVFEARMSMDSNLIASTFKEKQKEKELYLIYVPLAIVKNSTDTISTISRLTIVGQRQEGIPLYIIIISILAGFGLLIVVVYGLYMFHFFDRVYKDKLQQEKILDSGSGNKEELEGTSNEAIQNVELSEVN